MPIGKKELVTFKNIPFVIENYLAQIPEESRVIKRNADTWTIKEHIFHLVGVQEMLIGRMNKIIQENDPKIEPYFPDKEKDTKKEKYRSINSALKDYKRFRKQETAIIKNLDNITLDKTADHKEYIKYTIRLMISHMIYHEYWHMYRIEEIWLTKDEYFQ